MPATDSSSNGGAPSTRAADDGRAAREGEREATIDSLTVAVGQLRRGAAALKLENRELRAEMAGLERAASSRRSGDAPIREVTRLAEIALSPGPRAPGAARCVVDHCLSGLVTRRVLRDAELLVSELVTNSIDHGEPGEDDSVLVRVYLATDRLRIEIQNPGTAGAAADTSVWFEMARA